MKICNETYVCVKKSKCYIFIHKKEIIKKYNSDSFREKVNKLTANFSTSNVHSRSFIF